MTTSMWSRWVVSGVVLGFTAAVVLAADEGSIKGKVEFEGTPPKPRNMPVAADAHCAKAHPKGIDLQKVNVKDGGLADVFVQIKESTLPKDKKWEVPKGEDGKPRPVQLDQKGCEYHPHVFGIMVGQPLKVTNSDSTNHNIHGFPKKNSQFNFSQAQKGMEKLVELTKAEDFPIKCDVHNWMNAHAFVMTHPFFCVSDAEGKFEIKDVPPGTYDVEFWHETLGTKTVKGVKVEAGKPATAEAKFSAKKPAAPAKK